MPLERPHALACGSVPKSERLVTTSRKTEASVWAEGHGANKAGMPLERPHAPECIRKNPTGFRQSGFHFQPST